MDENRLQYCIYPFLSEIVGNRVFIYLGFMMIDFVFFFESFFEHCYIGYIASCSRYEGVI
jgi:hypothetical protein